MECWLRMEDSEVCCQVCLSVARKWRDDQTPLPLLEICFFRIFPSSWLRFSEPPNSRGPSWQLCAVQAFPRARVWGLWPVKFFLPLCNFGVKLSVGFFPPEIQLRWLDFFSTIDHGGGSFGARMIACGMNVSLNSGRLVCKQVFFFGVFFAKDRGFLVQTWRCLLKVFYIYIYIYRYIHKSFYIESRGWYLCLIFGA